MALEFHRGSLWPDAAGTPTDPTAAYAVAGPTFRVMRETELAFRITVATAACRAIGLEVQFQYRTGNWGTVVRKTIIGGGLGEHVLMVSVPSVGLYRVVPRRWGGTANTTFVIEGDSREFFGDMGHDGQPLELSEHQADGVECWGDGAGGAVAMAAAPGIVPEPQAAGDQQWIPTGEADTLVVDFTVAVAAPTTVELEVREQPTGTANAVEQPAVNTVVAGVVAQQIAQEQIAFGALDMRRTREIAVRPGMEILILAQYTGGVGGTTGYGVARLYKLGR